MFFYGTFVIDVAICHIQSLVRVFTSQLAKFLDAFQLTATKFKLSIGV